MASTRTLYRSIVTDLGPLQASVDHALARMADEKIIDRIRKHDHTVWKPDSKDITSRLGWLTIAERMQAQQNELTSLADELRAEGFTHALLMGMGGSSLAPEVFRKTFGVKSGYLDLAVIDSTDPRVVSAFEEHCDPAKTVYIVSTKSGGTVETYSFFKYFYNQAVEKMGGEHAGAHFIAITDPGSRLEALGRELGFRKIFLNDPNIGGRYSALSYFGLVPAALIGVDLTKLLDRAVAMTATDRDAGAHLGAAMGTAALAGRDKLTLILSSPIAPFGSWVEQLIAESTGKEGNGILPVDGEAMLAPGDYANDRLFVYLVFKGDTTYDDPVGELKKAGYPVVTIAIDDFFDLGGEFYRWEMATAVAGHQLGINPFDQPNVESAKVSARQMLAAHEEAGRLPTLDPTLVEDDIRVFTDTTGDSVKTVFQDFLSLGQAADAPSHLRPYVAIQAYLTPSSATNTALQQLRTQIQVRLKYATTVGYGPRFLHSTGQLHKGDGGMGLFIQLTDESAMDATSDIDIPNAPGENGSAITFGTLLAAQALGDRQALLDAGRRVIRFDLGRGVAGGLACLSQVVAAMKI